MMNIRDLLGVRRQDGDVGIEIEMEAENLFPGEGRIPDQWRAVSDGSLRGHSIEYVLKVPAPRKEIGRLVSGLKKSLEDFSTRTNYTFRAGVHIHVNVQEFTIDQVANFACVYYCLESMLMNFCGDSRKGNHFCLRAKDAEYPIHLLYQVVQTGSIGIMSNENIKYSALNFNSLSRFGSLEFRAMETQPDLSKVVDWANILLRIRDFALGLGSRKDIAYEISYLGPENWAKSVLGDDFYNMMNYPDLSKNLMEDMRRVQAVLYEPELVEATVTQTEQPSRGPLDEITLNPHAGRGRIVLTNPYSTDHVVGE